MPEKKEWEGYSVESLYNGIRSAEVNIKTFEDAIDRERKTQANYKWMIDKIEEKRNQKIKAEIAQAGVDAQIKAHNDKLEAQARAQGKRVAQVSNGKA